MEVPTIKHYYKKKLVNQNIEVEYNSEDDEIRVVVNHKLNNGTSLMSDHMRIHPSFVEPLIELLREVVKDA